MSAIDQA